MKRLILFLVRKRLGLKKYEYFQFTNQKSDAEYWFANDGVYKRWKTAYGCGMKKSSVSLNWLLDDECEIVKWRGE